MEHPLPRKVRTKKKKEEASETSSIEEQMRRLLLRAEEIFVFASESIAPSNSEVEEMISALEKFGDIGELHGVAGDMIAQAYFALLGTSEQRQDWLARWRLSAPYEECRQQLLKGINENGEETETTRAR